MSPGHHLSTFPAVLAVYSPLSYELRHELLDRTRLTGARIANYKHRELMTHDRIHEELLLD